MHLGRILWAGRWWTLTAFLLFAAGVASGWLVSQTEPDLVLAQIRPVVERIGGLGEQVTRSQSPLERTWIIYRNNAQAVSAMMLGGLILGLLPMLGMFGNGFIVGVVVGLSGRLAPAGADAWQMFLALAPHGVVELPAIWLGAAWAMKLGLGWLTPAAAGRRWDTFVQTAREAVVVLGVSMVLLLVSAVVEANLTLTLVRAGRVS
jgi:stage II sporulation protein M